MTIERLELKLGTIGIASAIVGGLLTAAGIATYNGNLDLELLKLLGH